MSYKYGTYGAIVESAVTLSADSGTVPVYFGTAPINLVKGWRDAGLVNRPVKIRSLADATSKVGYCDDFDDFTLCEAIAAHFDSDATGVGPIYLINVLDPDKHKAKAPITEMLNFANGQALIPGVNTIIDSVKIARPVDDPLPIGCMATKADANAALSSVGNKVTDAGDNTFYVIVPEPLDPKSDYLMVVETADKSYGMLAPKADRTKIPNCIKLYCQLNDGKMVDFVDGVKVKDPNTAKFDAKSYTGEIKVSLYKTDDQSGDAYPTGLELVSAATLAFEKGVSPQHYEPDVDYEIGYNATRGGVQIRDLTGEMPLAPTVTYELVDPSQVAVDDIVGFATSNGELSGIEALKLLYLADGAVANILAAPGWSGHPEVCAALGRACRKINGHWDAMYVVDIPLKDAEGEAVDTMAKAVQWKADQKVGGRGDLNALPYNDERSKVCWPMAQDAQGRIFHVSTLCVVEMLRTDQENGGIPMETPANKSVPMVRQYFGEASRNMGFDRRDADDVVMHGITTVTPWATNWTLWGDHTAAYEYGVDGLDPRVIFDNSLRMLMHITNSFQRDWEPMIDEPMTRSLIDTITAREQEKLDQLVSIGALIGKPTVAFDADENTYEAKLNGQFTWQIAVTPTPPLKAATVKVGYTDAGFVTYWGEEE